MPDLTGRPLDLTDEQSKLLKEFKDCCQCPVYEQDTRDLDLLRKKIASCKQKKIKDKAPTAVMIAIFLIAFVIVFKTIEKKTNPEISLKTLKNEQLISEEEYESKLQQAKQKKINDKLIRELDNLKNQGVLTDSEYREKVQQIQHRNSQS